MAGSDSFLADYTALTTGSGYVELADWSTIVMTGEDRHSFLHNMCTNDIRRLPMGEGCEAFCTDVKGKIVGQLFVFAREDRLELLTAAGQAESVIAHLERYLIREDVTLVDATADVSWLFAGVRKTASDLADLHSGEAAFVIPSHCCGLPGFLIPTIAGGTAIGGSCCFEAWEAVRIESGLPLFGVDFDNSHLPQEINRDQQAISFNKGCYLGQETIARIDALGHVNQKVVLVKFDGDTVPAVGLELNSGGKVVGLVTSSCWSPQSKSPLALAMVRRGSNEVESPLESNIGDATVTASKERPR